MLFLKKVFIFHRQNIFDRHELSSEYLYRQKIFDRHELSSENLPMQHNIAAKQCKIISSDAT